MKTFKDTTDACKNLNSDNIGEIIRLDGNQKVDFRFTIEYKQVTDYRMAKLKVLTPVARQD